MYSNLLPLCQFHLRRLLRAQPLLALAVAASSAALILSLFAYLSLAGAASAASSQLRALSGELRAAHVDAQAAPSQAVFHAFDSAQLVSALNRVAQDAKLPIDEISFVLDDNASMPYLRYHATLTVSASYPTIRRFIDRINASVADVTLDGITCERKDISAVALSCDLAFSAFYKKDGHG